MVMKKAWLSKVTSGAGKVLILDHLEALGRKAQKCGSQSNKSLNLRTLESIISRIPLSVSIMDVSDAFAKFEPDHRNFYVPPHVKV